MLRLYDDKCIRELTTNTNIRQTADAMAHHGKLLKRAIERAGLTQEDAALKMGFTTRHGLIRLFDKENLSEKYIEKAVVAFGIKREIFFPAPAKIESADSSSAQNLACWQQLAEARLEIIDLQKQLIKMSMPNVNAPRAKETA